MGLHGIQRLKGHTSVERQHQNAFNLFEQLDTVSICDDDANMKWSMWKPAQIFSVRLLVDRSLMGQRWVIDFDAAGPDKEKPSVPVPTYALQTHSVDLWVPTLTSSNVCSICEKDIQLDMSLLARFESL